MFICNECVEVCKEIIAYDDRQAPGARADVDVREGAEPRQLPDVPITGPAVRCALCRMLSPIADGILIPDRGVICPGCIGEIEATLAAIRLTES